MKRKQFYLGVVDLAILFGAFAAAGVMAQLQGALAWEPRLIWLPPAALILAYAVIFPLFRINETIWRYSNERDYLKIMATTIIVSGLCGVATELSGAANLSLIYYALAALLGATGTVLSRILYRLLIIRLKLHRNETDQPKAKRLLIVGAGFVGSSMITDIRTNPRCGLELIGLVDDNPEKRGRTIGGAQVLGSVKDIEKICKSKNVELIYIAIPSATNKQRARILKECEKTDCTVKILPAFSELENYEQSNKFINLVRDITPEELLGRDAISVADESIYEFVSGKTVLITGGGGSIGSELCRQVAAHAPKRLVVVDIYENNAYAIQQELRNKYGSDLNLEVYVASVRDYAKINLLFSREKPQVVFHAAAHKHVPLMEVSPEEAIKNNVFGTYNTALAAKNNGVDKFVLISTDKAVNPTNIMGASKRVCEMVIEYFNQISDHTTYAAVRFGNVLGSNGSVIPLFKEQIKLRHDVTVTDPRIIRYFMTIPEASQLVLTAGAMARGGEIFVLDMGEPVKIDDLARKMIRMSGLVLGQDINIKYVGLRPGEKLYEELLMSEEGLKKTLNQKIFISSVMPIPTEQMERHLNDLRTQVVERVEVTDQEVEQLLCRIVPTFHRYIPGQSAPQENEQKVAQPV